MLSPRTASEPELMGAQNVPVSSLALVATTVLGVGYVFPFLALTQPVDYWHHLFPDKNLDFQITAVFFGSNLAVLTGLVFFSSEPNFKIRLVGGMVGQFITLVFIPCLSWLRLHENGNYGAILGATAFCAVATAFVDSSLIAMIAHYPRRMQECLQLGMGVSGVIGSAFRIITKGAFGSDGITTSTLIFFFLGAATILLCIAAFFWLWNLPLTHVCLAAYKLRRDGVDSLLVPINEEPTTVKHKTRILQTILVNGCYVTLLFTVTLSLWPGLISSIPSFNSPWLNPSEWWAEIVLAVFNTCDTIGRLCSRWRGPLTPRNIGMPVAARLVFFPVVILSARGVFFTSDVWTIVIATTMGLSYGYLAVQSIVMTSELVSVEDKAFAGSTVAFFLNGGLVLGSAGGLVLQWLVLHQNVT